MSGIEYLWYNRDGTPRITGFLQSAIDKMAADIQQKVDELNAECGFTSAHVVEGTITVIDSDVLALPAPTTWCACPPRTEVPHACTSNIARRAKVK